MRLCSALLYGFAACATFLFYKKEEKYTARKDSREGGSESEDSEDVGLRPAFEIETSALTNLFPVEKYPKITDAKRGAQRFVVEVVMHV